MRIVAGKYGSRSLKSPKNDATRPTQDKIKGAIFSSLGNLFDGGNFLDCYSGTGNMGLEAVSRGMDHATLVDNNKGAVSVIKENVKSLKADKETKIICGNIFSVLERLTLKYDVVYIDPPYFSESTPISYHSRYHFLEGLIYYDDIETHINHNKVNLEIDINSHSEFDRKDIFKQNLRDLFKRYQKSILVLSYTTNGYPSIEELKEVMKDFKRNVKIISLGEKPFALNHKNKGREEVLIIGQ